MGSFRDIATVEVKKGDPRILRITVLDANIRQDQFERVIRLGDQLNPPDTRTHRYIARLNKVNNVELGAVLIEQDPTTTELALEYAKRITKWLAASATLVYVFLALYFANRLISVEDPVLAFFVCVTLSALGIWTVGRKNQ